MICPRCGKITGYTAIRNYRMCYSCWKALQARKLTATEVEHGVENVC